jgi:hemolysin activation/secretion protein
MAPGVGRLLAVLLVLFPAVAAAQAIPSGALPGTERRQIAPPVQGPRAQPVGPGISLPSTVAPPGAESIMLTVSRIVITGATVYGEQDFAPLYADLVGHEVPLAAVYELARRITAKYGAAGYILSRAVVPPQNFGRHDAVIQIQVVEGYIDSVIWPVETLARYRNFFDDYTARIIADRPANIRTLERYLLLANDLPGLKFATTLKPSPTHPNASTLIVEVTEKRIDAIARIDNRGTEQRGPWQYLGSATVNNILAAHEAFTVTYAGTFQLEELQYIAANYKQVLNSEGLTGFINGSYGFGRPGGDVLNALNYKTRSTIVEAGLTYPVIRSRETNLYLTALGFLTNDDSFETGDPFTRDRIRGFRLKGDADWADRLLGINQVNVTFSQGLQILDATPNADPNPNLLQPLPTASTNAGHTDFNKIEATFARTQPLFAGFSAFVAAYGQYAFTPLLVSEQCSYGGRFFGRAYDPSQFLGDSCWMALGEARYDIPNTIKQITRAQIYAYADHGQIYNIDPALGTPKQAHGSSVGVGARAEWEGAYSVDLSIAKAIDGPHSDELRAFVILAAKY